MCYHLQLLLSLNISLLQTIRNLDHHCFVDLTSTQSPSVGSSTSDPSVLSQLDYCNSVVRLLMIVFL